MTMEQREELGWPAQLAKPEPITSLRKGTLMVIRSSNHYPYYPPITVRLSDPVSVLLEDVEHFFEYHGTIRFILDSPTWKPASPTIISWTDPKNIEVTFAELNLPESLTSVKALIIFPLRGGG